MKHLLLGIIFTMLAWAQVSAQSNSASAINTGNTDPDIPAFPGKSIDKGEYLRLRNNQIDQLRGLPYMNAGTERSKAIQQMERQAISKFSTVSSSTWTPIGPEPIPNGQTNSTVNSVSGRISCIAVDPTDANIAYVGAAQGGVYRTTDGGAHWTAIFDNAQSLAIGAIAVAPSEHTIVYVGTGEPNLSGDSYFGIGLYRIDNATTTADLVGPINPSITTGTTTALTYNCFTGRSISKILVHPTDPATIFVSTSSGIGGIGQTSYSTIVPVAECGLFRSTNATSAANSVTFSKIVVTTAGGFDVPSTGNRSIMDIVFDPGGPDTLLASVFGATNVAGDGGIYRTTNSFDSSPTFTQTYLLKSFVRGSLSIARISSQTTVLCAYDSASGRLRSSTDGGISWSSVISGVNGFCDGQCWYDNVPGLDPTDPQTILLGGSANSGSAFIMKKSTNGGTTWSFVDVGLHADEHSIVFAPSNHNIVYTGNDGGIFQSTDGGSTWTSRNTTDISATQFQSIAVHPTDPLFTIGGTQDNGTPFRQSNGIWTRADFGDGGFSLIDQNATNDTDVTMYHTYFNQTSSLIGFARSQKTRCAVDGQWVFRGFGGNNASIGCAGQTLGATNGISSTDNVLFYAPMALGPGNPNTLYFGTDRLYRSTNRGDAMSLVSQGPFQSGIPVSAIGISPQDDNVRIVGLVNGKVFATTTGSSTLTDITSASFPANPSGSTTKYVSRTIIDPNNSGVGYVAFSFYAAAGNGIWKTSNLTSSAGWAASSNGIPSVPINALVIDPLNSNNLFAGTDIGVYNSTDGGANWSPYSSGLPRVAVFDMAITPAHTLRIATHGRGMWESNDAPLPIQMTTLSASIMDAQNVKIDWSTVSETNNYGYYVERRQERSAGYAAVSPFIPGNGTTLEAHAYTWSDSNLAPGVYFYRIRQVDLDGSVSLSNPITITITGVLSVRNSPGRYEFSLAQNYPNPFNPKTTVKFSVQKQEHAVVRVYNSIGQRVVTLFEGVANPGNTYSLVFDASKLSSGIYLCQIVTDSHLAIQKMMLQK